MRAEKRRAAMRRIVARMLNRDLDRGWATWSQAAKAWRKQQNTMGQVVSHMRNQDLIWGFLSWRETWRVILRQRELIENVGNMLANKDVARGFRGWAGGARDRLATESAAASAADRTAGAVGRTPPTNTDGAGRPHMAVGAARAGGSRFRATSR